MKHYYTDNTDLESKPRTIEYDYGGHRLTLISDLGVFAKNRIDFGTHLLLQTFYSYGGAVHKNRILDVGCGYGIIGLALAKAFPDVQVELVDVNMRAVELARKNAASLGAENATVYQSNLYQKTDNLFDIIITNPPIRAGKKTVYAIFQEGWRHLVGGGEIWAVVRKNQGAVTLINKIAILYQEVITVKKSKGYYVFYAKKGIPDSAKKPLTS